MSLSDAARFGLSDEYWNSLSEKSRALYREFRPLRRSIYAVQNKILHIERTLENLARDAGSQGGELELNPDFQRGHVWTQAKQSAFMEAVIRGTAPMTIRFNCPAWNGSLEKGMVEGLNPHSVLCVDGLQRLTAMRDFVAGKFKVFDRYSVEDLEDTSFSFNRMGAMWTMEMFNIASRADLLQFYLDLNSGGVVHTADELARVGQLLVEAKGSAASTTKPSRRQGKG